MLLDFLPAGCTTEACNAENLLQVGSSDRQKTLEEQLDDVQTQISMANSRLQLKRSKLKRSKRRQIIRELRTLELTQRDAEMHKLSRRLCKQSIGPKNRTYGRYPRQEAWQTDMGGFHEGARGPRWMLSSGD